MPYETRDHESHRAHGVIIGCAVALVLYVLSPGPMIAFLRPTLIGSPPPPYVRMIQWFYAPLEFAYDHAPPRVHDAYQRYLHLWGGP